MKKVLVTGANGHIGYQLCQQLIQKGYNVRAMVRNINVRPYVELRSLELELIEGDCLDRPSLDKAMAGIEGVFHLAAVFDNSINEINAIVKPNIDITENVLRAAKHANVQRIIYTSSIAAIGTTPIGQPALSIQVYNDKTDQLYARSKALSEQHAWQLANELNLNMATVLPGSVLGPSHNKPTDSTAVIEQLLQGKIPFAVPMQFSYVDVRDVANAHILVYESKLNSRNVAVSFEASAKTIIQQVKKFRKVKASEYVLPIWVCNMLPFVDWVSSKLTGTKRLMTKSVIKEYIGRQQKYSDTTLKDQLNWKTYSIEDTILSTIESLEKNSEQHKKKSIS